MIWLLFNTYAQHCDEANNRIANFINILRRPETVAERSKAFTVFARSEARIIGSISIQSMDDWCVYAFILGL
jgi:hypothetical protein